MVDFLSNANTLVGIGAVIFALSYTVAQLRGGAGKSNSELATQAASLADTYKKQYEAQIAVNMSLQKQLSDMRQDLGRLQGMNEANEKKLQEYMALIGPSGELKQTLNRLSESAQVSNLAMEFMNDIREGKISFPSPSTITVKDTTTTVKNK